MLLIHLAGTLQLFANEMNDRIDKEPQFGLAFMHLIDAARWVLKS